MIKEQNNYRYKFSSRTRKRRNNAEPWSKYDIQRLIELYPRTYNFELARMFRRTESGIKAIGERFGLHKKYDDTFKPFRPLGWKRWTDAEVRILKKMYLTHTFEEITDVIDRTRVAITGKLRKLKLEKFKIKDWTKKEDAYLRRYFATKSRKEIGQKIGRTEDAVCCRVVKLGLEREPDFWTDKEIELLKRYYPVKTSKELVKLINRSVGGIRAKAKKLDLQKEDGSRIIADRRWNKKEVEKMFRLYKNHTAAQVASIIGQPVRFIKTFLINYGPAKEKLWTKKENAIIRKYYGKMRPKKLAEKLGRTYHSVQGRISYLGLVKIKRKKWNDDEERVLTREYKKGMPVKKIAKLLGKKRDACYNKITRLGLR